DRALARGPGGSPRADEPAPRALLPGRDRGPAPRQQPGHGWCPAAAGPRPENPLLADLLLRLRVLRRSRARHRGLPRRRRRPARYPIPATFAGRAPCRPLAGGTNPPDLAGRRSAG